MHFLSLARHWMLSITSKSYKPISTAWKFDMVSIQRRTFERMIFPLTKRMHETHNSERKFYYHSPKSFPYFLFAENFPLIWHHTKTSGSHCKKQDVIGFTAYVMCLHSSILIYFFPNDWIKLVVFSKHGEKTLKRTHITSTVSTLQIRISSFR